MAEYIVMWWEDTAHRPHPDEFKGRTLVEDRVSENETVMRHGQRMYKVDTDFGGHGDHFYVPCQKVPEAPMYEI